MNEDLNEDDIFAAAARALNIKIPQHLRNMLTINDYNDVGLLAEIKECNLTDMETFARGTLHEIIDKSEYEEYYGIFKDKVEKFQFLSSHREIIFKLKEYCRSKHDVVVQSVSNAQVNTTTVHHTPGTSKNVNKEICFVDTSLSEENAHISKTMKAWLRCNLPEPQLVQYESKINDLKVVSKLDTSGSLTACITCFMCKTVIKVHKIARNQKQRPRWVLGNFHKHVLNHLKTKVTTETTTVCCRNVTKPDEPKMKVRTLTTYFQTLQNHSQKPSCFQLESSPKQTEQKTIKILQDISLSNQDTEKDKVENFSDGIGEKQSQSARDEEKNNNCCGEFMEENERLKTNISDQFQRKATKWTTEKYQRVERQRRARERFISNQTLITNYYTVVTDVARLMQENETLKKMLLENWSNRYGDDNNYYCAKSPELVDNAEKLLDILMNTSMQNSRRPKNQNSYNTTIKQFALYIFFIGGRLLYETLQSNLQNTLPSITSLFRFIDKKSSRPHEGSFRFNELNTFLEQRNLPKYIWIGEDATRINGKIEYDLKTNNLVGFTLPLYNGVPVIDSFEATSAKAIFDFFSSEKKANYAYVIMAQPLAENSPAFCLNIFATDNKFTANDVVKRWDEITQIAGKFGITVLGYSADGDSRLLKAMKINTQFPYQSENHNLLKGICDRGSNSDDDSNENFSQKWKWFKINSKLKNECFVQDTVHILTKMRTRLLKPSIVLPLGQYVASATHLKLLVHDYSKDKHKLTISDLKPEDKMNFASAEKMCSSAVLKLLPNIPGSDGTLAFLKVMNFIIDSFLSKNSDIEHRIYCIWYAVFFLRIWKSWLRDNKSLYNEKDNFITTNCYMCVELNAHALLKLLQLFVTNNELNTSMFLPWLYSSQMCEKIFRATRSLTSTFSTVVNFSMLDILHRLNRIEIINNLTHDLSDTITFPREKKRKILNQDINKFLSSCSEENFQDNVEKIVNSALEDAILDMRKLGIEVNEGSWNQIFVPENKKNENKNTKQKRLQKNQNLTQETVANNKYSVADTSEAASLGQYSDEETIEQDEECIDDELTIINEEERIQNISFDDDKNVSNEDIFEISLLKNAGGSLLFKDCTDKCKGSNFYAKGPFARVLMKDKVTVVKKSSLCWLLNTENQRVSSDRLRRFICDNKSGTETSNNCTVDPIVKVEKRTHLRIGDWCLFYNSIPKNTRSKTLGRKTNCNKLKLDNYICGRILYFKGFSNKNPTSVESNTNGVGCLCTWYSIQNDGKLIHSSSFRHEFYDIAHYRLSMPNPSVIPNEKSGNIDLVLDDQTLTTLVKETENYSEIESPTPRLECENFAIDCKTALTDSSDTDDDAEDWEAEDDSLYDNSTDENVSDTSPLADIASSQAHVDIKIENYYAVFYDDSWYIGRVIEIVDKHISRVKFLKENLRQLFWPKRDDIQEVENEYIYYGPIILQGVGPFSITESVRTSIINGSKEIKRKHKLEHK